MASASGIRLGKVFVEIGADPSKLFGALNRLNKRIGSIGREMTNFGGRMTAIGGALAAPLALASRQFATFDDAIRATAAVTGSLGPQGAAALAMLNDRARELGATTSFTAVQVANLMTELGRAGFNPEEINAMTGAVLNLARATGTDATLSAGIMAATLRQFSLGAGDAARVADVLTAAANSTFNTVEGLGESLKYAGPVAQSLGMSLEDTVAVLGVLGNVGIQGSEAGTALRRLSVIAAGSGEKLQELFGISNTDAEGNLKPLIQILDEINTATANMPVAERTAAMAEAFGLLGITSANVLSQTAGGVANLAEELKNSQGTAARTAKEMDAGLGGAMRILISAIEGASLALGEALAPSLEYVIRGITDAVGGITQFIKNNEELIVSAAKGIAIFTAVGLAITGAGMALVALSAAIGVALNPFVAIPAIAAAAIAALVAFDGGFGDLAATASTTFEGIYHAIADGDLAGAMDILWAGLFAAYLRGEEALMNAIDPWVTLMQNTFTYLSANVLSVWDAMIENMASSWDYLEATVRKGQNFLQAAFQGAEATALNDVAIDNEMADRRRRREEMRQDRGAQADATADQRNQEAEDRKKRRKRDRQAAEQNVAGMASGKKEERVRNQQFADLLDNVQNATTLDALRDLYGEFDALSTFGRLTPSQMDILDEAFADAQERISKGMGSSTGGGGGGAAAGGKPGGSAGGGSALEDNMLQALIDSQEVAGTFSAFGLNGMGFGSNLQQLQLDALKEIAANTRDLENGEVGE